MKRLLSGVVVLCLLIAPVLMLMPGALAQTYEGELTIEDVDGGERSLFSIGEGVVFHVEAFEIVGGDSYELQHEILDFIVMRGGNVVWTLSAPTGANGVAEVTYYPMETGSHTVRVNYTDTILDTGTFMVYEPYLDSVNVKTSGFDWDSWEWFSTTVFRADDDMRIEVEALDQHGKIYTPGFGQYQVYYNITKDSTDVRDGSIWVSRNNGEGSTDFYLTNYDEGSYLIEIFEDWSREDLLGSAVFYVLDLEITISPDRDTYAQGQEITIDVSTSLDGSYQVRIVNETEVVMTGADWSASGSLWSRDYTIPGTVKDGVYSVQVLQDDNVLESVNFVVVRFWLTVETNKNSYLPGEPGTLFFAVTSNLDGSPVSADISAKLEYWDDDTNQGEDPTVENVDTRTASSGSMSFTMPTDARTGVSWHRFQVEAESAEGDTVEETKDVWCRDLSIGGIANSGVYVSGQAMHLSVGAYAGGSPVKGVDVTIQGEMDDEDVAWLSESVTTDGDGFASVVVMIPEDADEGNYAINFTGAFSKDQEDTDFAYFVIDDTLEAYVDVRLDKARYISGDDVVVDYTIIEGIEKTTGHVNYSASLGGKTIDMGHSDDGSIEFTLPSDSAGTLTVMLAGITESGLEFNGGDSAGVSRAYLAVYSPSDLFSHGDKVSFHYNLVGDSVVGVVCEITDANGEIVQITEPSSSPVTFTTPKDGVSNRYTAAFYVTGEKGVYTGSETVWEKVGYVFSYSLDKRYAKAGSTIEVSYTITPTGDPPGVVRGFYLTGQLLNMGGLDENTIWTDKMEGTFEYTLPEDLPDGEYIFVVEADAVDNVPVYQDGGGLKSIAVDSSSVAGMPLGNFLALLIGIVALIIGLVLMFRKPKTGAAPPPEGGGSEPSRDAPPQEPQPDVKPEPFQDSPQQPAEEPGVEQPAPQPDTPDQPGPPQEPQQPQ